MSGNDLVRFWKDPDERGGDPVGPTAHPAGDITLDGLSGAADRPAVVGSSFWWPSCNDSMCVYCPPDWPQL